MSILAIEVKREEEKKEHVSISGVKVLEKKKQKFGKR